MLDATEGLLAPVGGKDAARHTKQNDWPRRGWKPGCRPRFQTAGQCRQNVIRNVALKKRGWP